MFEIHSNKNPKTPRWREPSPCSGMIEDAGRAQETTLCTMTRRGALSLGGEGRALEARGTHHAWHRKQQRPNTDDEQEFKMSSPLQISRDQALRQRFEGTIAKARSHPVPGSFVDTVEKPLLPAEVLRGDRASTDRPKNRLARPPVQVKASRGGGKGFFGGIISGIGKAFGSVFKGIGKAFGSVFKGIGKAFGALIGKGVDCAVLGLAGFVERIQGLFSKGRSLTDDQKVRYRNVYGSTVDLDSVRIRRGGPLSWGASKTIGNTIFLQDDCFDANGQLNELGKNTLDHEMAHIWQYQNGGSDYIHGSIFAQAMGMVTDGDRRAAYDWRSAFNDGLAFCDLNPEQQASLIATATRLSPNGGPIEARSSITEAEAAYLNAALAEVRAGRGAP
ncbi:MAG: hypothetical protein IPK13_12720 [Deltaproteobacteria bacterium]|nr:hypothetical protein [Deltaproteobacteria bacterium]